MHARVFPDAFMKYPVRQTHCPSSPLLGSHDAFNGQSAELRQTLLVPETAKEEK